MLNKLADEINYYPYTKTSARSKHELFDMMESVKEKGYAVDNEEHDPGVRCLAATVRDYTGRIIAAVSAAGDRRVVCPERDDEIGRYVMETAGAISKRMGYTCAK